MKTFDENTPNQIITFAIATPMDLNDPETLLFVLRKVVSAPDAVDHIRECFIVDRNNGEDYYKGMN